MLLLKSALVASVATALRFNGGPARAPSSAQAKPAPVLNHQHVANTFAAAAALSLTLGVTPASALSKTAAQISLNAVPPTTIDVQVKDLPVVGALLSGTYTKVADGSVAAPAVTIKSPADKVNAVKAIATTGHLEFDVDGLLATHLDVDVAVDTPGVAMIRVASPLIPKLPFKNAASPAAVVPAVAETTTKKYSGKTSAWKSVTDLGTGTTYYYNDKTGATQFEKPAV
mmetsp:Transcript_1934/g.7459  ORF Transcript_1934/g.7459 Transcript_1934/m.7459 type:complete len:228 (+) Transcript_1934:55-738(+)